LAYQWCQHYQKHLSSVITSPLKAPGVLKAPRSSKSIRRFHTSYERSPTADKVKTLFSTTLQLSAQVSVLQHQNRGLQKAIELQKKKNRQGVRLNLCGQPNKETIGCYSPAQVVKAREFHEQKEAVKAAEEAAKYQKKKVQRAANTLRKAKEREEKEARAAAKQLKKDLANAIPAAKKPSTKKTKPVADKAKKAAPTVSKTQKAPIKAKPRAKSTVKGVVVAPAEEVVASGVAVTKRSGRAINLPQRYV
jgi:hypothetical protein